MYTSHGISLSKRQISKLKNGHTVRLTNKALDGPIQVQLTKAQYNKIQRAKANGKGCDISFSESQRAIQGMGLWDNIKRGAKAIVNNETVRGIAKNVGNKIVQRVTPKIEEKLSDFANAGLKRVGLGVSRKYGRPPRTIEGEGWFSDVVSSVAPKVINAGVDFGLKKLTGGGKRGRPRKQPGVQGEGWFSDVVSSVAPKVINAGVDFGLKKLTGGGKRRKNGGLIYPPGM